MIQFQPSPHSYGATDSPEDSAALLEEYAPAISALLFGGDPREKYEKKKANLETYKQLYESANTRLLRSVYAAKIRSLQGEIKALEGLVREERTAVITTQVGKISGTFLLLAGGITAVMAANYFRQKAKTEKWQRSRQ